MRKIRLQYAHLTAGDHNVGLVGDFNAWQIEDMYDVGGTYQADLNLEPGVYRYKLIVDGNWISDPANPLTEDDPYGGKNSLLIIAEQEYKITWDDIVSNVKNEALTAPIDSVTPSPEKVLWTLTHEHNLVTINRIDKQSFEFRFSWFSGLAELVTLYISNAPVELTKIGTNKHFDLWHCIIKNHGVISNIKFYTEIEYQNQRLFHGLSGICKDQQSVIPFNLSVHKLPVFEIPEWVKHGIIYQIFPDRFHNGNPDIDPDFSEWYYQDSRTLPPNGEVLEPQQEYYHLVQDWRDISGLTQSPYLPSGKPDWWSFYGGDIAGVLQKLDYLQDLGVTIIYFNPLWKAKSNHKYDSADYMSIDPHFGTKEDMCGLVSAAHQKGIRVIIDVAFNHTGETFWAFRDTIEKGPFSDYWNWYDWHKYPVPNPLPPDFQPKEYYQCWWGIKDMPDLNYDLSRLHPEENYVKNIKYAVTNQPLVDYVLRAVEWWLSEIDVDGFRLDVPEEVPFWFWELFRKKVKGIKSDAWIVGELWNNAEEWVNPVYFDSIMNYAYFKAPVIEYLLARSIDQTDFQRRICEGLTIYPIQSLQAMMNLLGSHDTWRILELAKSDVQLLKLAITFQMSFIGTPHIYYGDEICMHGKKDPDNRRPFNWNWEKRAEAVELHDFYRQMIRIRKDNPVLTEGEFAFVPESTQICHYHRFDLDSDIHIIINPTDEGIAFKFPQTAKLLADTGAWDSNTGIINPKSAIIYQETAQLSV